MIKNIEREVRQLNILGKIVDLKPITQSTMDKIKAMQNKEMSGIEDFKDLLKLGIGEDKYKEVFPSPDDEDFEIIIDSGLAVFEIFVEAIKERTDKFGKNIAGERYSPNRATRRQTQKKKK